MASPTRWTWVWASSGNCWWTGRPGVLQSMGLQRVRHDWATELNWTKLNWWLKVLAVWGAGGGPSLIDRCQRRGSDTRDTGRPWAQLNPYLSSPCPDSESYHLRISFHSWRHCRFLRVWGGVGGWWGPGLTPALQKSKARSERAGPGGPLHGATSCSQGAFLCGWEKVLRSQQWVFISRWRDVGFEPRKGMRLLTWVRFDFGDSSVWRVGVDR